MTPISKDREIYPFLIVSKFDIVIIALNRDIDIITVIANPSVLEGVAIFVV